MGAAIGYGGVACYSHELVCYSHRSHSSRGCRYPFRSNVWPAAGGRLAATAVAIIAADTTEGAATAVAIIAADTTEGAK